MKRLKAAKNLPEAQQKEVSDFNRKVDEMLERHKKCWTSIYTTADEFYARKAQIREAIAELREMIAQDPADHTLLSNTT
jgi:hypothetical protein